MHDASVAQLKMLGLTLASLALYIAAGYLINIVRCWYHGVNVYDMSAYRHYSDMTYGDWDRLADPVLMHIIWPVYVPWIGLMWVFRQLKGRGISPSDAAEWAARMGSRTDE